MAGEAKVETHLHREVEKAGGTTRKFVSPGHRGVPDRVVIWPRVHPLTYYRHQPNVVHAAEVHFVETKAPGKDAEKHQAREHVRLQKLGCVVLVLDTIRKVDNYVKRFK